MPCKSSEMLQFLLRSELEAILVPTAPNNRVGAGVSLKYPNQAISAPRNLPPFGANPSREKAPIPGLLPPTSLETSVLWLTSPKSGNQLDSYHKASSLTFAIQLETSDLWLTAQKSGNQLDSYHKASSLTFAIQYSHVIKSV
ncbi:hypothetical protein HN51_050710 [Arachis hypogaea]